MATTDLGKVKGSSVYSLPIDTLGMIYTFGEVTIGGSTSTQVTGYLYCFKVPDDLVEKLLDGDSIIAYLPESTRSAFAAIDITFLDIFYGGLTVATDPPMRSTIVPYYFDAPLEQMTQWDDTTAPYPGYSYIYYGEIVNGDYILWSMKVDITYDETSGESFETVTFAPQLGGESGKSFVLLDITGQDITAPSSSTSTKSIDVVNNSVYDNALSITIRDTYAMLVSDDMNINGTIIPLLPRVDRSSEQPEANFNGSKLQYNTAFYNALMAGEFPTIKPVPFISDDMFESARDGSSIANVASISGTDNVTNPLGSPVYGSCEMQCSYDLSNGLSWSGSFDLDSLPGVSTLMKINSDSIEDLSIFKPSNMSGDRTSIADVLDTSGSVVGTIFFYDSNGTMQLRFKRSDSSAGASTIKDIVPRPYGSDTYPSFNLSDSTPTINQLFSMALPDEDFATFIDKGSAPVPQKTFVTAEQFRSNAVTHWEKYDILDLAFTASQDVAVSNNSSFLITDGHTVQLFLEADLVFNSAETANAYPILTLINLDGTSTFSEQAGGGTQYKDAVVNMAVTDKSLYTVTGYIAQRNKSTNNLEDNYMPGASVKYAGYDMQGTKVHAVALFINALGVPDDGFLTTKKYNFHLSATYPIN